MRASTAAAILAFCSVQSIAAPVEPGTALDPSFSLRCLDSPDLQCKGPFPGEDEFGQPQVIPDSKRSALGPIITSGDLGLDPGFSLRCLDDPDLDCNTKREAEPLGWLLGARVGAAIGKWFLFNDKKKRDTLLPALDNLKLPIVGEIDDLPILDDLPIIGDLLPGSDKKEKRQDFTWLKDLLGKIDPNDDSPYSPFDDEGLPGKRSAKAFVA